MSAAQKIRIDDLREPVLTPAQRAALAFAERSPVSLTVDSVLTAAVERTGLYDFGPDDFRERLALWLSEMDDDPERTALGRASLWNDCVRCAANRLRIHALLAEGSEAGVIEEHERELIEALPAALGAPAELVEAASRLDKHYILTRYPNGFASGYPGKLYTPGEANGAIDDAHAILAFCRGRLPRS